MRWLTFLGDLYLPQRIDVDVDLVPYIPNVEYALSARGRMQPGKVNLVAQSLNLSTSFGEPPLAACLANNHVMDHGQEGFDALVAALTAEGAAVYGAGRVRENVGNPALLQLGELRVSFAGYVCPTTSPVFADGGHAGVAAIKKAAIRRDMLQARELGADRIVLSLHWGGQESTYPRLEDIALARELADAGADLIVGHHAHCVQACEVYRGTPVFYGLGNCAMPDLDLPADFDAETGEARMRYFKKQLPWNRRSVAVRWDPVTGEVQQLGLRFDGACLRPDPSVVAPQLEIGAPDHYQARARREYQRRQLLLRMTKLAHRPRLPGLAQLRNFVRLLTRPPMK